MMKYIKQILALEDEFDAEAQEHKELKRVYRIHLIGTFLLLSAILIVGHLLTSEMSPSQSINSLYGALTSVAYLFLTMYVLPLVIKLWTLTMWKGELKRKEIKTIE